MITAKEAKTRTDYQRNQEIYCINDLIKDAIYNKQYQVEIPKDLYLKHSTDIHNLFEKGLGYEIYIPRQGPDEDKVYLRWS